MVSELVCEECGKPAWQIVYTDEAGTIIGERWCELHARRGQELEMWAYPVAYFTKAEESSAGEEVSQTSRCPECAKKEPGGECAFHESESELRAAWADNAKLEKQNAKMRAALEWYATLEIYDSDYGSEAREALSSSACNQGDKK